MWKSEGGLAFSGMGEVFWHSFEDCMTDLKNVFKVIKGLKNLTIVRWIRYIVTDQSMLRLRKDLHVLVFVVYLHTEYNRRKIQPIHLHITPYNGAIYTLRQCYGKTKRKLYLLREKYLVPESATEFKTNHFIHYDLYLIIFLHLRKKKYASTLTIIFEAYRSVYSFLILAILGTLKQRFYWFLYGTITPRQGWSDY